MTDRWMEERERRMREGDWRLSQQYGAGGYDKPDPSQMGGADREGEDRSWSHGDKTDGRAYSTYRPGAQRARYTDADRYYNNEGYRLARPHADHQQGGIDYRHGAPGYEAPRYYGSPPPRSYDAGYRPYVRSEKAFRGHRSGTEDFMYRAGEKVAAFFRGDGHRPLEAKSARGLGPKNYTRSDARISDDVHDRLTDDNWLDASDIEVQVAGGEVTLSGVVEDRGSKHLAERIAEEVSGVRHVQNNLRVSGQPTGPINAGGRETPQDKPAD